MTECVATCKSEGRTQTSCTLSASPVYFSVQVLCISRCWSCVFLSAALCVHIFLLRVETALRRLAHSMSGLRGYYRTNIETPPPSLLISSVFLFSRTSGSGDDDEEINGTIHNCRHAIRQNTLIFVTTCPNPPSPLNITLAMSPLWSQKPRSTVLPQMPASVCLLRLPVVATVLCSKVTKDMSQLPFCIGAVAANLQHAPNDCSTSASTSILNCTSTSLHKIYATPNRVPLAATN